MCLAALVFAGVMASWAPGADADYRAWKAATPCTVRTPASQLGECLSTQRAVIARTKVVNGKGTSRLYFTGGRPLEQLAVSRSAAEDFRSGDRVTLTVWRHQVRVVTGEDHVWRYHFPSATYAAVVAAGSALAGVWFGAEFLVRLRGRKVSEEALPSLRPVAVAIGGTALWLLPLCYVHPTTLISSPVARGWGAAGTLASLALFVRAWRATRIRTPETPDTSAQQPPRPATR